MNAEFNWWLLLVGIVAGAGLAWLVLADLNRRDEELDSAETSAEAAWLAGSIDDRRLDADLAERVLRAHRRYLGFPPPDELVAPGELGQHDRVDEAPAADAPAADPAP